MDDLVKRTATDVDFLMRWAFENHARLELDGEVGFGRPCVGILASNGSYPDWSDEDWLDEAPWSVTKPWVVPEAAPPAGIEAYHKHPCLAVLGRGDEAVVQLAAWVRNLSENGIFIKLIDRHSDNVFDLIFHGGQQAILTRDGNSIKRIGEANG